MNEILTFFSNSNILFEWIQEIVARHQGENSGVVNVLCINN